MADSGAGITLKDRVAMASRLIMAGVVWAP